jgi:hypothetical protein
MSASHAPNAGLRRQNRSNRAQIGPFRGLARQGLGGRPRDFSPFTRSQVKACPSACLVCWVSGLLPLTIRWTCSRLMPALAATPLMDAARLAFRSVFGENRMARRRRRMSSSESICGVVLQREEPRARCGDLSCRCQDISQVIDIACMFCGTKDTNSSTCMYLMLQLVTHKQNPRFWRGLRWIRPVRLAFC